LRDLEAVDLRAVIARLEARFKYPGGKAVLSAFERISDQGFGSLQFFLPQEYGAAPAGGAKPGAWSKGLGNWENL
jgi:hypothetical protein